MKLFYRFFLVVTFVASQLTLVLATTQSLVARKWTNMLNVDATKYTALVFSARALLGALFLATSVIRFAHELHASNLSIHVATATPHFCKEIARCAFAFVTRSLAGVWTTWNNCKKKN